MNDVRIVLGHGRVCLSRRRLTDTEPTELHWVWEGWKVAELSQTKLPMPLLVIGGEKALGGVLGEQAKLVASDVTVTVLKDTGHWVLEERPKDTTDALEKFL